MFYQTYFPGSYFPDDFFQKPAGTATGFITAHLTGTSAVAALATGVGHMSADLSGSGDVAADLTEAPAGFMEATLSGTSDLAGNLGALAGMEATLSGTSTFTAVHAPVLAQDDKSAGPYRRRASAVPLALPRLVAALGRVWHSASASPAPVLSPVTMGVGRVNASADATSAPTGVYASLRVGLYVRAQANAAAPAASMRASITSRPVQAYASSSAQVRRAALAAKLGRVGVSIGPNLILMDDEEVLFLLEVA